MSNRTDEIDYEEPFAICVFTITGTDTLNTTIDMRNNVVFNESRFTDLFAANRSVPFRGYLRSTAYSAVTTALTTFSSVLVS